MQNTAPKFDSFEYVRMIPFVMYENAVQFKQHYRTLVHLSRYIPYHAFSLVVCGGVSYSRFPYTLDQMFFFLLKFDGELFI